MKSVKLDEKGNTGLNLLPFNKARTRAILRIGPHNKQVLSILICGMLAD